MRTLAVLPHLLKVARGIVLWQVLVLRDGLAKHDCLARKFSKRLQLHRPSKADAQASVRERSIRTRTLSRAQTCSNMRGMSS